MKHLVLLAVGLLLNLSAFAANPTLELKTSQGTLVIELYADKAPKRAPIENEAKNGLKNSVGTLAMARTGDPHSATAQFFINLVDNVPLDYPSRDGWGYAVFGKVTQGLDVVQKIAKVKTGNAGMHQNVPTTPVVIESVKLLTEK
jgi:peptidyl-prolyl cis-trans isomerase A (cyclophilin A)